MIQDISYFTSENLSLFTFIFLMTYLHNLLLNTVNVTYGKNLLGDTI